MKNPFHIFRESPEQLFNKRLVFDMPPKKPGSTPKSEKTKGKLSKEEQTQRDNIEKRLLGKEGQESSIDKIQDKLAKLDKLDGDLKIADGLYSAFAAFATRVGSSQLGRTIATTKNFQELKERVKNLDSVKMKNTERLEVMKRIDDGVENALVRVQLRKQAAEKILRMPEKLQVPLATSFERAISTHLGAKLEVGKIRETIPYFAIQENIHEIGKFEGLGQGPENAKGSDKLAAYPLPADKPTFIRVFNAWYQMEPNGQPALYAIQANGRVQKSVMGDKGFSGYKEVKDYPTEWKELAMRDNFITARKLIPQGLKNHAFELRMQFERNDPRSKDTKQSLRKFFEQKRTASEAARSNRSAGGTEFIREMGNTINRLLQEGGLLKGFMDILEKLLPGIADWVKDNKDLPTEKLPRKDSKEEAQELNKEKIEDNMDVILEHPGADQLEWGETEVDANLVPLARVKLKKGVTNIQRSNIKVNGLPTPQLEVKVNSTTGMITLESINRKFKLVEGDKITFNAEQKNGSSTIQKQKLNFTVRKAPSTTTEKDAEIDQLNTKIGAIDTNTGGPTVIGNLMPARGHVESRKITKIIVAKKELVGATATINDITGAITITNGKIPIGVDVTLKLEIKQKGSSTSKTIDIKTFELEQTPGPGESNIQFDEKAVYEQKNNQIIHRKGALKGAEIAKFKDLNKPMVGGTAVNRKQVRSFTVTDKNGADITSKFLPLANHTKNDDGLVMLKTNETLTEGDYNLTMTVKDAPGLYRKTRAFKQEMKLTIREETDLKPTDVQLEDPKNNKVTLGPINSSKANGQLVAKIQPARAGIVKRVMKTKGLELKPDGRVLVVNGKILNWKQGDTKTIEIEVTNEANKKETHSVTVEVSDVVAPLPEDIPDIEDQVYMRGDLTRSTHIKAINIGEPRYGVTRTAEVTQIGNSSADKNSFNVEYKNGKIVWKGNNTLHANQEATVTVTDTVGTQKAQKTFKIIAKPEYKPTDEDVQFSEGNIIGKDKDTVLISRGTIGGPGMSDTPIVRMPVRINNKRKILRSQRRNRVIIKRANGTSEVAIKNKDYSYDGDVFVWKGGGKEINPQDKLEIHLNYKSRKIGSKKQKEKLTIEFGEVGETEVTRNKVVETKTSDSILKSKESVTKALGIPSNSITIAPAENGSYLVANDNRTTKIVKSGAKLKITVGGDSIELDDAPRNEQHMIQTAVLINKALSTWRKATFEDAVLNSTKDPKPYTVIDGDELDIQTNNTFITDPTLITTAKLAEGYPGGKSTYMQDISKLLNNAFKAEINNSAQYIQSRLNAYTSIAAGEKNTIKLSGNKVSSEKYSYDGGKIWYSVPRASSEITIPASQLNKKAGEKIKILLSSEPLSGNQQASVVEIKFKVSEPYSTLVSQKTILQQHVNDMSKGSRYELSVDKGTQNPYNFQQMPDGTIKIWNGVALKGKHIGNLKVDKKSADISSSGYTKVDDRYSIEIDNKNNPRKITVKYKP